MNAGAAEIDITPDFPTDLSGFASRAQPSTGVLDRIFARGVYLESEGERLLWITCDLVALGAELVDSVRAFAARELGLEARQVLLSTTHTHYAPAVVDLFACGQTSDAYMAFLQKQLESLAKRLTRSTQAFELVIAGASCALAVDRRNKPSTHVDPQVWAIGVRGREGAFIGAVINYTMHPVTFGHIERRISADWCGVVSREVSAALPGQPVVMVSNGAAGNINPPRIDQPPEAAGEYGRTIAGTILPGLRDAGAQHSPSLDVRSITMPIDLDWHDSTEIDRIADRYIADLSKNAWGEQFRLAINAWREKMKRTVAAGGGRTWPIEIQAIRIGDATLIAINGEMFTRFTDILRRRFPNRRIFTVAYSNRAFGYIPTREAYAEGGYEVETAHFFYGSFRPKAGSLEVLADRAAELINTLNP